VLLLAVVDMESRDWYTTLVNPRLADPRACIITPEQAIHGKPGERSFASDAVQPTLGVVGPPGWCEACAMSGVSAVQN
jgi:hypothetical protein